MATDGKKIVQSKIDAKARGFSLAYIKHLRTGRNYGHKNFEHDLRIYAELYNELFGFTYDADALIKQYCNECAVAIDAENKQEVFDFDAAQG